LATCIDRGVGEVRTQQESLRTQVEDVRRVAATLDPDQGSVQRRRALFGSLRRRFEQSDSPIRKAMAKTMKSFAKGLFVGEEVPDAPPDNLDLERFFRCPKGHERRIHGHCHAGVRIVIKGPTLIAVLDAHLEHPEVFRVEELTPYAQAPIPEAQHQAVHRRRVMSQARSSKQRSLLLDQLERRYQDSS